MSKARQAPLGAFAAEAGSPGFSEKSGNPWGFDHYGPTADRPLPEAEGLAPTVAGYDKRELLGTGLGPADLDPLGAWQWQSGPERFRRVATGEPPTHHPDDEHRETNFPDAEEAAIAADLAETMTETKSETTAVDCTEIVTDGGGPEPTERIVVYTAPGLDGAVHRVTATNTTWTVDVARQFAAADLRNRTGGLPCDVDDIEIIDFRKTQPDFQRGDRVRVTQGGHAGLTGEVVDVDEQARIVDSTGFEATIRHAGGRATFGCSLLELADEENPAPDGGQVVEAEADDSDELPGVYDPDAETVGDGWEGEYIYSSWGYGQTNVELAKITEVSDSGKTVLARLVRAETADHGRTSRSLAPTDDAYGDAFRLHVRGYGDTPSFRGSYPLGPDGDMDDSTRLGSFGWFEDVSGESVHATAPGYGH